MVKSFVCAFCESKWTYATREEFICRKCGRRIAREEVLADDKYEKIEEIKQ